VAQGIQAHHFVALVVGPHHFVALVVGPHHFVAVGLQVHFVVGKMLQRHHFVAAVAEVQLELAMLPELLLGPLCRHGLCMLPLVFLPNNPH
jgi:hypothetical protein